MVMGSETKLLVPSVPAALMLKGITGSIPNIITRLSTAAMSRLVVFNPFMIVHPP